MTLFELLVALVIVAAATTFVGVAVSAGQDARRLDQAADQLERDLARLGQQARLQGHGLTLHIEADGYRVDGLDLRRHWPAGLDSAWAVRADGRWRVVERVDILPPPSPLELRVRLRRDGETRDVHLAPLSGRVVRDG